MSGQLQRAPELVVIWPLATLREIETDSPKPTAIVIGTETNELTKQMLGSGLVDVLSRVGGELIALVGPAAEDLHDVLDWLLEEAGAEEVVTSWHGPEDLEDAAALVAASCQASDLKRIVLIADITTESGASLKRSLDRGIDLTGKH